MSRRGEGAAKLRVRIRRRAGGFSIGRLAVITVAALLVGLPAPTLLISLGLGKVTVDWPVADAVTMCVSGVIAFSAAMWLWAAQRRRSIEAVLGAGMLAVLCFGSVIGTRGGGGATLEMYVSPRDVGRIASGESLSSVNVVIEPHSDGGVMSLDVIGADGPWSSTVNLLNEAVSIPVPMSWSRIREVRLLRDGYVLRRLINPSVPAESVGRRLMRTPHRADLQ